LGRKEILKQTQNPRPPRHLGTPEETLGTKAAALHLSISEALHLCSSASLADGSELYDNIQQSKRYSGKTRGRKKQTFSTLEIGSFGGDKESLAK